MGQVFLISPIKRQRLGSFSFSTGLLDVTHKAENPRQMYDSDAFDSHGQFNVISKWSGQADAGKILSQKDPNETDCSCRPCVFFSSSMG